MVFQSLFLSSPAMCRVTLLSTSVKSYSRQLLTGPPYSCRPRMRRAYRNKEARGPVGAIKGSRKQLQPCVVPVHNQLPRALGLHLRQPRVLRRQAGALVPFVEVENDIEKGGDRAGSYRLESRHRDGRGGGMRREGECGAIANEPRPVSLGGPG